jgi:hypothetical protein
VAGGEGVDLETLAAQLKYVHGQIIKIKTHVSIAVHRYTFR